MLALLLANCFYETQHSFCMFTLFFHDLFVKDKAEAYLLSDVFLRVIDLK
jgi:hypothetical protein